MFPCLPNEIWTIIWQYHYRNIRILAAKKKEELNKTIFESSMDDDITSSITYSTSIPESSIAIMNPLRDVSPAKATKPV